MSIVARLKLLFRRTRSILYPIPNVGGLQISDSAIRLAIFETDEPDIISLKLPSGTIANGKIADRKTLLEALINIRSRVLGLDKELSVILSLPPADVYTQVFSLPLLPGTQIREAAKLNLQMISPVSGVSGYSDYHQIGEENMGDQLEFLGAFAEASVVDDFTKLLREAGFITVAVEFPGLALTRFLNRFASYGIEKSYLVISISDDGILMCILRTGILYFSHFSYWSVIQESGGAAQFIVNEIKRVTSFYMNRCRCALTDILFITTASEDGAMKVIHDNFLGINIQKVVLTPPHSLPSSGYVAVGSAIRGRVPRFQDTEISLASVGARESYLQSFILNFVSSWRNVAAAVLIVLALAFLITDTAVARFSFFLSRDLAQLGANEDIISFNVLVKQAERFNHLVSLAASAYDQSPDWSPFFERIQSIAGKNRVGVNRLSIGENRNALFIGQAKSEKAVIDFKNGLEALKDNISDVVLPLTDIKVSADGSFIFTMTFKATSLSF